MKGSVFEQKDRGRWAVSWYQNGKTHAVTKYPDTDLYLYTKEIAEKCRSIIQADEERCIREKVPFYIERYTGKRYTNVLDFYREWMAECIEPKRKPATVKGYWSYFHTWIKPFFKANVIMLHEIQYDTLTKLLNYIELSGKGKMNVMMSLHSMMTYAHKSNRIRVMPPFPSREDYNIVEPTIRWLGSEKFWKVINAIEYEHRPIFLWMYYHIMREAEACVLQWKDWDEVNRAFYVKRSLSARKTVESTKTSQIYTAACVTNFLPYIETLKQQSEKYRSNHVFTNPNARRISKRYTNESINIVWKRACKKVGIEIRPYAGTRHSRASQMLNELGMNIHEIKEAGPWKRLDSVKRYATTGIERKRELLERNLNQARKRELMETRKVIDINERIKKI